MPQSHQLEPLHQPHSDRCHLPVVNTLVGGSPPTLSQVGRVPAHLWRAPTCLLQLGFPKHQTHMNTHISLLPVDAKLPDRPPCLDGKDTDVSLRAALHWGGCLEKGSPCLLCRHLLGWPVEPGTHHGTGLRDGAGSQPRRAAAGPALLRSLQPCQGCWRSRSSPCPMLSEQRGPDTHQVGASRNPETPGWRSNLRQERVQGKPRQMLHFSRQGQLYSSQPAHCFGVRGGKPAGRRDRRESCPHLLLPMDSATAKSLSLPHGAVLGASLGREARRVPAKTPGCCAQALTPPSPETSVNSLNPECHPREPTPTKPQLSCSTSRDRSLGANLVQATNAAALNHPQGTWGS